MTWSSSHPSARAKPREARGSRAQPGHPRRYDPVRARRRRPRARDERQPRLRRSGLLAGGLAQGPGHTENDRRLGPRHPARDRRRRRARYRGARDRGGRSRARRGQCGVQAPGGLCGRHRHASARRPAGDGPRASEACRRRDGRGGARCVSGGFHAARHAGLGLTVLESVAGGQCRPFPAGAAPLRGPSLRTRPTARRTDWSRWDAPARRGRSQARGDEARSGGAPRQACADRTGQGARFARAPARGDPQRGAVFAALRVHPHPVRLRGRRIPAPPRPARRVLRACRRNDVHGERSRRRGGPMRRSHTSSCTPCKTSDGISRPDPATTPATATVPRP